MHAIFLGCARMYACARVYVRVCACVYGYVFACGSTVFLHIHVKSPNSLRTVFARKIVDLTRDYTALSFSEAANV